MTAALRNYLEDELADVVVVYKIDRLSRSLADFDKLTAVLDRKMCEHVHTILKESPRKRAARTHGPRRRHC